MSNPSEYTTVSWDKLEDYPCKPLPEDHPWPKRENLSIRAYGAPRGCEHLVFSIGHLIKTADITPPPTTRSEGVSIKARIVPPDKIEPTIAAIAKTSPTMVAISIVYPIAKFASSSIGSDLPGMNFKKI